MSYYATIFDFIWTSNTSTSHRRHAYPPRFSGRFLLQKFQNWLASSSESMERSKAKLIHERRVFWKTIIDRFRQRNAVIKFNCFATYRTQRFHSTMRSFQHLASLTQILGLQSLNSVNYFGHKKKMLDIIFAV